MPKNIYETGDKYTIADELGITLDVNDPAFDNAVRAKLQAQSYDAVHYGTGTLDAEELHIFGKTTAPTVLTPRIQQEVGQPEAGIKQPKRTLPKQYVEQIREESPDALTAKENIAKARKAYTDGDLMALEDMGLEELSKELNLILFFMFI